MQLTLFQYCQEQQRELNEFPIRLAWAEAPPQLGQAVGMGHQRRWQVVQVHPFRPETEVAIAAVHLALIALPEGSSEQADWDCWRYRHLVPQENIYVHLEDIGLPELGIGFNCLNQPPALGQQLFAAEATGDGSKLMPRMRPWQIERYDSYQPSQEGCPYTAVHLSWCSALSNELVTA
ncbi:hypothetical protein [Pseudanabaena sp. FACHB-2040]|uniref:hypothetical protein n=1 Tax=Pseudanabaena sp. FACHB-2040 TaxID=2692859 RepID=UPI0016873D5D|nr:hypothetical protein [Pseudanabaena sp. FACHB-2040]MBD2261056.1 hypothetical protein [Pseudanabaena sp. FACHB-2040]